ncbi:MAG: collagen-like protein, partial [Aliivibrio sp.]|nr:collagen-like protein [Aliivibrio sp.]
MASITNVKICDGYDGLIKTSNNAAITSTPVQLTDGLGNNLPIQVGTNSTIFSQTVDFTNATVVGAAGEKGDKGDQGIQGVTGATGPAGAKGDKGDAGIASNGYYASFYD